MSTLESMIHWNYKQYISISIEGEYVTCIALDSNFDMRANVSPFKGTFSQFYQWLETLNLKANSKNEIAGIKALCYKKSNDLEILLNNTKLSYEIIDVFSIVNYFNDHDGMHVRKISFPKTILHYVASQLNINEPKGSWKNVLEVTKIYKKLTERGVL